MDSRHAANSEPLPPSAAAGRYRIERLLARGGQARVYLAASAADGGKQVALKRLCEPASPGERARFEREFHVLKRTRHPNLIEVYELGSDEAGTYLSMELVDGPELQRLAPLPWRQVCAIARQLCGALSSLHAQRLVHRQLNPRSVRRGANGACKLLDYRGLAPFGTSKELAGTPPCSAPENVQLRRLDARTDLFALGATLYFALVGQHAYPAREYAELNDAWQHGFAHASELVPDVPAALDALLCDLLRLDPEARPASASEVAARLSAIDGANDDDDQARVEGGYLATPALVGRDDVLIKLRGSFKRASTGGKLLIEGAPGVGRTRTLDACLLEATLLGITVLTADAADAASGEYGVMRALSERLFAALPQLAREAAGSQLELLSSLTAAERVAPDDELQSVLSDWLRAVSRARPLMIGIDDHARIDAASASVLARATAEPAPGLWLACCVEPGRAGSLLRHARRIRVDVLGPADVERLLCSLFGALPQLSLMAQRAHALSAGRPRELLRMAQCWVDRGVVRWADGKWRFAGFSP